MTLADERLRQLDDSALDADASALRRCELAADLMLRGQYEAAREALGGLWRGTGRRPEVEGLGRAAAAEVILQAGVLSGWLGASSPAAGAQEVAKNLISESAALFESLGDAERAAGARGDLALCYWREGAYDEARVLLTEAFQQATETVWKAKLVTRLATVEFSAGQYNDALALLTRHAALFDGRVSHAVRGSFHNLLALVLKQLGVTEGRPDYLDRAIIELTAAIHHQELAGHERFCATNENNLANLLRSMGRYEQAHEHLDRAAAALRRLGDATLLAYAEETRAAVFLAEKKYAEAARAVARAVRTFEEGGAAGLLSEALTTQGVVRARLGDPEGSVADLRRAVRVAEEAGALLNAGVAALTLIEEHGARPDFPQEELYELYLCADRLLKDTQHPETVARLRGCARVVMRRLSDVRLGEEEFSFYGAVHEFEERIIEQALRETQGSVVKAAKLLGLRHQTFSSMLSQRHQKLTSKRKPRQKRRRSLIKKGP